MSDYGKYPKILYIDVSDTVANPEEAIWLVFTLFSIPLSSLRVNCIKSKTKAKKYEIKFLKF